MDNNIIVIDDEIDFLESVRRALITSGFKNVRIEADPTRVPPLLKQGETFDVALIDITMPGMDGIELLDVIRNTSPNTECIMVTAIDEARVAVQCLRQGAYDYLVKPISKEDLVLSINHALERKRLFDIIDLGKRATVPKLAHPEAFRPIVTRSANMFRILKEAELHAASDVPILITGETGTGKELLAKAIHTASSRARFLFTPINMDSITPTLFDTEFFGHTKGAFTGAEKDRVGYLEHTNRGTIFLDEIGHLPLELQGKLLRVLQEGEFIKLGTNKPRKTDVRFIAATNANLDKLLARGAFRKDLYYRLRGGWLHLPPLKERKEDIPLLIKKFLEEFGNHGGSIGIEDEAVSLLMDYSYPGNVRELRSIIQSAVNLSQGRPISVNFLAENIQKRKPGTRVTPSPKSGDIVSLEEMEKDYILKVYKQFGNNKSQTAKALGIGLNTLRRKLEQYGID